MTSSLDDQQERHYIGNLLCDEDVFGQTNAHTIETSGTGGIPSGNVLSSSGPVGPAPPNRTFWPEPPPPYSPCSITPSQWAPVGRQGPGLMAPPPVAGPFGQAPTATAVTRTDFYQSPFGNHGEWDNLPGAPVDAYLPGGMSFTPHRTVSILKPMMTPSGTLDTVQQHHYQNMYRHHHQHLGSTRVDPRMFSAPPPPPTPAYSALDENTLLHIDPYLPSHLPSKGIKKTTSNPLSVENISSKFSSEVTTGFVPPLGKSYRDVASKKERGVSSSSLSSVLSNPPAPVRHTSSSSSGGKDGGHTTTNARRLTSAHRVNGDRHSSGEIPISPMSCTGSDVYIEQEEENMARKALKGSDHGGKKAGENEFQKITHKKNKSTKNNKNDQVITDEDGLAGSQVVDASSRFDVLQSLGTQATNVAAAPHRAAGVVKRRSLSSVIVHRESSTDKTTKSKAGDISLESGDQDEADENVMIEEKTTDFCNNEIKRPSLSVQRSLLKKVIGARRELSVHATADTARCGRKQRNNAKKRQNTAADYINIVGALLFSIVKCAIQWIVDLVIDISLQLWDITEYASYWENIRIFNAKRMWSIPSESNEWGLSDNIQLPVTGEEAMERILRCRGRDAYVILGLRADCTDDDIKRYYKRQAVLVHPDKNRLSGADESFKILSKAFDAIGTPDARAKYNLHKSPLQKEMEELWERLREKMNEARNAMYCDCGSKHTRVPIESIRASEARYCKKCKLRHPAKHNDIWAETRFGGLIWVYYACLDGVVYDITQWAKCSSNHLKHMKANSHVVQYRLVTTTGPSVNKNTSKQSRTGQLHRDYDDLCCYGRGQGDGGCGCSVPFGYEDPATAGMAASQQASYRPPERNSYDNDRPRRAGRRRRLR